MISSFVTAIRGGIPRSVKDVLLYIFSSHFRRKRRLIEEISHQTKNLVGSGPFKGMWYAKISYGSQILPKMVGTYEKELHPVIEDILTNKYKTIINIGAGEGYYAVGLSRAIPSSACVCFESHKLSRKLLEKTGRRNNVRDRMKFLGVCTVDALREYVDEPNPNSVLVVCDVEGAEIDILVPSSAPGLTRAHVLVEVHSDAIAEELWQRFVKSHSIVRIPSADRVFPDWPADINLGEEFRLEAMAEYRGPMEWFWMVPKSVPLQP